MVLDGVATLFLLVASEKGLAAASCKKAADRLVEDELLDSLPSAGNRATFRRCLFHCLSSFRLDAGVRGMVMAKRFSWLRVSTCKIMR